MELVEKQMYNAHLKFIRKKLIECDGNLSQKEITNLLHCLEFLAIHNNALEREFMDLEHQNEDLRASVRKVLTDYL